MFHTIKDVVFSYSTKIKKINFEEMQLAIQEKNTIIINTMKINEQDCLIINTISFLKEETIMNELMDSNQIDIKIVVYGKNSIDNTVEHKCKQLIDLGFKNVSMYTGGMFEWLLLQDIYGELNFLTTKKMVDILLFK
jgi:rhodanese-related sulfurtransferase